MHTRHPERHRSDRIGWLRASVLGANDGIVSTASLIVGVAAAATPHAGILVAGVAGLVAGSMSMAAGEYVSVSSQSDTEEADLARERTELAESPASELEELVGIYIRRGLEPEVARKVAEQLTAHDALAAHARDELGIVAANTARPVQAAIASAISFAVGAALPLFVAWFLPGDRLSIGVVAVSLCSLAALGAAGARGGGAPMGRASLRVLFWGALAMALTAGVGKLFGVAVA